VWEGPLGPTERASAMKESIPARPVSHHALVGGLIAVALECLVLPQLFMTEQMLGRIWPSPTPEAVHAAQALFHGLSMPVLLAQCVIALLIARKTWPRWWWGLSPAIARAFFPVVAIALVLAGASPFHSRTGAQGMVSSLGFSVICIGVAPFIGSLLGRRGGTRPDSHPAVS